MCTRNTDNLIAIPLWKRVIVWPSAFNQQQQKRSSANDKRENNLKFSFGRVSFIHHECGTGVTFANELVLMLIAEGGDDPKTWAACQTANKSPRMITDTHTHTHDQNGYVQDANW